MKSGKSWLMALFFALIKIVCAYWNIVYSAPLELKNIPADAAWVAHIDVDAARSSKVVQKFYEECVAECCRGRIGMDVILCHFGVQKIDDLHAITAFGTTFEPHTGVLMVRAKFDQAALHEKVEKVRDHKEIDYGQHEIHTWVMHHGMKHEREAAGTLYSPDLLVFACSVDLLKSTLDVLDGKAAGLSAKDNPLAEKVPEGAIFLVRAVGVNKAEMVKNHCPILRQIERLDYAEGQTGDQWTGKLAVTADSKTAADNLKEVFDGVKSFVSLYSRDNQSMTEMLGDVKVSSEGNAVRIAFEESAGKLAEQAPAICKAIHKHLRKHGLPWNQEKGATRHHRDGERGEHGDGDRD